MIDATHPPIRRCPVATPSRVAQPCCVRIAPKAATALAKGVPMVPSSCCLPSASGIFQLGSLRHATLALP
jgi:hypothetical protein